MEVRIAVTKINKYASLESGDTLEVVERPNGGLSVVLADGQTSGLSLPSEKAQSALLRSVYRNAGVEPDELTDLLEKREGDAVTAGERP